MRALLLAGALALTLAAPAAAHRGHAVLSVVEIDLQTRIVTITHRMAAHDVEPALPAIAPEAQPSLDDPAAVEALADYVAEAFTIGDGQSRAMVSLQGFEAAGDNVVLRYRASLSGDAQTLEIDSDLFEETHPDMENQVNVRVNGVTRTLIFRPGDAPQTLPLRPR